MGTNRKTSDDSLDEMLEDLSNGKGTYSKVCACGCGETFIGRRNKKFYNETHKANFNNEKRAERMEKLTGTFTVMQNNYRILEKYYPKSKGKPIPYFWLLKEGFNPNAPFQRAKGRDDGEEYFALADLMFRQPPRDKERIIIEINENEDHIL